LNQQKTKNTFCSTVSLGSSFIGFGKKFVVNVVDVDDVDDVVVVVLVEF
jgi:hypothetical protein